MKKIFILTLLLCLKLNAQNKIIYLISGPRSLTTIFMRTFEGRNDMVLYHEPSIQPFVLTENPGWKANFKDDAFKTYKEMTNAFDQALKTSHVFVKGMSTISHKFVTEQCNFLHQPHVYFL